MKIGKIGLTHLHNNAHFQFHTDFRSLVLQFGISDLKIAQQFNDYTMLYEREDEALKRIVKSDFTRKIKEANKARDRLYITLVEFNRAMCNHFDPKYSEPAKRLKIVFDTYGNIAKLPINEQTSAIYNLCEELRSVKYRDDSTVIGIFGWIDKLDVKNYELGELMKERVNEKADKSKILMPDARKELDEAYRNISDIINVYVLLEGATMYETFIDKLNIVIAKYSVKKHHNRRKTETQEENEEENQN